MYDTAQTGQPTSNIDLDALNNLTRQELSSRPDQPNMVTKGANPLANGEDPLAKLLGLVKGKDGKLDELKIKRTFVVTNKKIANKALRLFEQNCRLEGMTTEQILGIILDLDERIESGQLDEDYFKQMTDNAK